MYAIGFAWVTQRQKLPGSIQRLLGAIVQSRLSVACHGNVKKISMESRGSRTARAKMKNYAQALPQRGSPRVQCLIEKSGHKHNELPVV
ncbi:MAG: hypothetical protein CL581_05460 [Alteromonadaceae bacterium]|nr:hypothetical protein [Alteromonadaceae bacterium]MBH86998.1 hypothetical protein [Alteromonadaceae bacterium]